jgi:hypothetical protein
MEITFDVPRLGRYPDLLRTPLVTGVALAYVPEAVSPLKCHMPPIRFVSWSYKHAELAGRTKRVRDWPDRHTADQTQRSGRPGTPMHSWVNSFWLDVFLSIPRQ